MATERQTPRPKTFLNGVSVRGSLPDFGSGVIPRLYSTEQKVGSHTLIFIEAIVPTRREIPLMELGADGELVQITTKDEHGKDIAATKEDTFMEEVTCLAGIGGFESRNIPKAAVDTTVMGEVAMAIRRIVPEHQESRYTVSTIKERLTFIWDKMGNIERFHLTDAEKIPLDSHGLSHIEYATGILERRGSDNIPHYYYAKVEMKRNGSTIAEYKIMSEQQFK
jgi:hypothetical protein